MAARELWTVKSMIAWCEDYLSKKGDTHPRLSAEWLLSAATGLSRIQLYMDYARPLSSEELAWMHDGVKRRGSGEPLQYITGQAAFRHIIVDCAPGVLIPRPETEILVDEVLKIIDRETKKSRLAQALSATDEIDAAVHTTDGRNEAASTVGNLSVKEDSAEEATDGADVPEVQVKPLRILEIGVGTACISCSLAHERNRVQIIGTDISETAYELACQNVEKLGLKDRISIELCDLDSAIPVDERFDILVSNPPYVPTHVIDKIPGEVKDFEPHLALDGGDDGLDIFRRLIQISPQRLNEGGWLLVELFETTLDTAAMLLQETGVFDQIEIVEDLTGRPRHIKARYCSSKSEE